VEGVIMEESPNATSPKDVICCSRSTVRASMSVDQIYVWRHGSGTALKTKTRCNGKSLNVMNCYKAKPADGRPGAAASKMLSQQDFTNNLSRKFAIVQTIFLGRVSYTGRVRTIKVTLTVLSSFSASAF
jgi:hypothetical protein